MKTFNGKAIYQPAGKAGEYSYWACNTHVGCSHGCEYCYCKKGILAPVMGMDKPQLKKCFKDEEHALEVFTKELLQNKEELQKHGLFFTFTSDPFLEETIGITQDAIAICKQNRIPVKILTKTTWWVDEVVLGASKYGVNKKIAFGFTLTGHDELEKGASTNQERIEAMKKLHDAGFKTWASIEPIIDFDSSYEMIKQTAHFCDLYKIGLMSGAKIDKMELYRFLELTSLYLSPIKTKIYFKDSLLKQADIARESLPANCVSRDYNIFNQ